MQATASARTPIMLSAHHSWNLEAYAESQDMVAHRMQVAASRVIGVDGIIVPDGSLWNVEGTPLDFRTPASLGVGIQATKGKQYCGTGACPCEAAQTCSSGLTLHVRLCRL
jgi:aldose 1-epimerase